MKKKLLIDLDTERKGGSVLVLYPDTGEKLDPVLDMATLCEAVCTIIHAAHDAGIKKDFESVRDCIEHIKKGFIDESYIAYIEKPNKKPGDTGKEA